MGRGRKESFYSQKESQLNFLAIQNSIFVQQFRYQLHLSPLKNSNHFHFSRISPITTCFKINHNSLNSLINILKKTAIIKKGKSFWLNEVFLEVNFKYTRRMLRKSETFLPLRLLLLSSNNNHHNFFVSPVEIKQ